jgi:hypothetical protein
MAKEEALKYLDDITIFFNAGWNSLFKVKTK